MASMASNNFFSSPLLLNTGLGLLAGAQPMPYGQNRFAPVIQGVQSGLMQQQALKKAQMEEEVANLQMEQIKSEQAQRNSMLSARATLLGGLDPTTGITWNQGRSMPQSEQVSALAQAYPEPFGKGLVNQMFPTPAKTSNALKVVADPDSPTGYSYRDLHNNIIPNAPPPRNPKTEVNLNWPDNLKETPEMISKGEFFKRDAQGNIVFGEDGLPQIVHAEGGKTEREISSEAEKKANLEESRRYYGNVVIEDSLRGADILVKAIAQGKKNLLLPNAVAGWGGLLKFVPASDAKQLSTFLETMKANIGFDRLQVMRQNSPSGGALGNVSNFEVGTLQATQGNLDQTQKPEDLLENIIRINAMYAVVTGRKEGLVDSEKLDSADPSVSGPERKKFRDLVDEVRSEMRQKLGVKVKRWRYDPATRVMEPVE